jgi:hypothetical protein
MPKRKSNSNKKLKPKLKPKTRSLTKKSGLKKSTKIIIGVVCVLAIVGIIVGIIVGTGTADAGNAGNAGTSGNKDNIDILPSKDNTIIDSKLINDLMDTNNEGYEDNNKTILKKNLLDNYIQRNILLYGKKYSIYVHKILKINNILSNNYGLIQYFDMFEGRYSITMGNGVILKKNEYRYMWGYVFNVYIDIIATILDQDVSYFNDNIERLKYLYILGNLEIEEIEAMEPLEATVLYKDINYKEYMKKLEKENDNSGGGSIKELDKLFKKIYDNIDTLNDNMIENLYNMTSLKIYSNGEESKTIVNLKVNIKPTDINTYGDYREQLCDALLKYYILDLNYKYYKLKNDYVKNLLPDNEDTNEDDNEIGPDDNEIGPDDNEIGPVETYIYNISENKVVQLKIKSTSESEGQHTTLTYFVISTIGYIDKEYYDNEIIKPLLDEDPNIIKDPKIINEALEILKPILVKNGKNDIKETTDITLLENYIKIELLQSVTEEEVVNATTEKLKKHNQAYIDKLVKQDIDIVNLSYGLEDINKLILDNFNLSN